MLRRMLDLLYDACAVAAALLMVLILGIILAQSIGRQFGVVVPSANEVAGFAFAAVVFLALAPTFRAGGHIRVSLLLQALAPGPRRWVEVFCLAVAIALAAFLTVYLGRTALGSLGYGDVSPGLLRIPLWIPQAAMVAGVGVFAVALIDALVTVLAGRTPSHLAERPADETPVE